MRGYNNRRSRWNPVRAKKRAHSAILTLDDLPKNNLKYSQLIAQLQARYKAAKELDDEKPAQQTIGRQAGPVRY